LPNDEGKGTRKIFKKGADRIMHQEAYRSLKERRIQAGYKTASDFSRDIGISAARYNIIEAGQRDFKTIDIAIKERIATALGASLKEVFPQIDKRISCKSWVDPLDRIEFELMAMFGNKLEPIKDTLENRRKIAKLANLGRSEL
jgi:transcriptional regulator with XRE-family HTH domain